MRLCFVSPCFAGLLCVNAVASAADLTVEQARQQRFEAAHQPRRLVFHSDGVAMDPKHAYHEPVPSVIPHLPGTQVQACTYSLIHQFPVVRLYRSKAGQEWPAGITEKLFGREGPDGLDQYIAFCRKQGYEAFWAMRTNDTHDAASTPHGLERWNSNLWKQAHQDWLFGTRDGPAPPFGSWTAFDYARAEVRDKVFSLVEEVGNNYPVDGLVLDFFRHLPTFKSTAWGAKSASDEERAALTGLMRRLRDMRDKVGREKGRPLLLAVRTPDTFEYCGAMGFDLETWMREGLMDVWITGGYFRLQEWDEIVKMARPHKIPVWASMDESRVKGRENKNTAEAYRARIMNAWRAGVDTIWMFNYFYFPGSPQFEVLKQAASIEALAFADKDYVPDDLSRWYAGHYLADGVTYHKRAEAPSPETPWTLKSGESRQVELRVGDDMKSVPGHGIFSLITLRLQADRMPSGLSVRLNDNVLEPRETLDGWTEFPVRSSVLKLGVNRVQLSRPPAPDPGAEMTLQDLQLAIRYHPIR